MIRRTVNPTHAISESELTVLCERWHIRRLALFGSVLRDDFRPDSDVDPNVFPN